MSARDEIRAWKHVFKLDPEREISDEAVERLCESGTDAILVGGSSGVTYENTTQLLARIRRYALPCALEISDPDAVAPGFDLYMLPTVLNSAKRDWIVGRHHRAIKAFGNRIPWEHVVTEGYVILNAASTAAHVTDAETRMDVQDVQAYACLAEAMFALPIFYMEYSGVFGDMTMVRSAAQALKESRLFYGGGIRDKQSAELAAAAADTIVVGNIIYDDLQAALSTVTIKKNG